MGLFDIFKEKDPLRRELEGNRYFNTGAYDKARLEYEYALAKRRRKSPGDIKIPVLQRKILQCREYLAREHKRRGDDLVESGSYRDARKYYNAALDLTGNPDLVKEILGCRRHIEYLQADKYKNRRSGSGDPPFETNAHPVSNYIDEEATALFNTLPDDMRETYLNYGANFQRGYIALNRGQFDLAAHELSRALEENPEPESFIRLELATAYLNLKRFEKARVLLEEFITHRQDFLPLTACWMLCEIYWETDSYDRALAFLDLLFKGQPESSDYCLLRGETLFRSGRISQAESLYSAYLSDNRWDVNIVTALARASEALGDLQNARDWYEEVIGSCKSCQDPVDPGILRRYADLCMETGIQNEKILEIYLILAEQDSANASGYYQKVSRIYAALGHEKESRRFQLISLGYEGESSSEN